MQYQITGKHIDIGDALQTHVRDSLDEVVGKYAERPTDANVVFSKSGKEYVCEATVHLSTGLTAQAKAHTHDIYGAFDICADVSAGISAITVLLRRPCSLMSARRPSQSILRDFGSTSSSMSCLYVSIGRMP